MDSTRSSRTPRSSQRRKIATAVAGGAALALAVGLTATANASTATPPTARHAAAAQSAGTFHPVSEDDYYKDAEGKTGKDLKTALHKIISSNVDTVSYSQVWDALKDTDQDPKNPDNVIEIYSGKSIAKDKSGGAQGDWNREHVWAKSHGDFGTSNGPGTDLHHLRPEDVQVNADRGNKDFDEGGSAVDNCDGCKTDSDSFEPRDAVKGDVARMILYMAVRYDGGDGFPDLEPDNKVDNGTAPAIGKLSVLKKWNDEDPVSDTEKTRNKVIYDKYQHNRNPFIDHPEWVDKIWN